MEYAEGVDELTIALGYDAYSNDRSCTCVNSNVSVNKFVFSRFYINPKKASGKDYETDTLKSTQESVNGYLADKKLNNNMITDKEFKHSRDILLSKRKLLGQLEKETHENHFYWRGIFRIYMERETNKDKN